MFHRSGAVRDRVATWTRGELVPLPSLSPEQRAAALEKAAEIRKARAELKEQLKQGKTTLAAVLNRAEHDDVVGKLKVSAVLQAMPGIGKIRATQIMERLKIADSRRLRGLGEQQRKALLGEFAAN
jgi:transposase